MQHTVSLFDFIQLHTQIQIQKKIKQTNIYRKWRKAKSTRNCGARPNKNKPGTTPGHGGKSSHSRRPIKLQFFFRAQTLFLVLCAHWFSSTRRKKILSLPFSPHYLGSVETAPLLALTYSWCHLDSTTPLVSRRDPENGKLEALPHWLPFRTEQNHFQSIYSNSRIKNPNVIKFRHTYTHTQKNNSRLFLPCNQCRDH